MSTSNLLPGGVLRIAPVSGSNLQTNPTYNLSPSEDLHRTVTKLLEANSCLQEKVKELEGDKKHFQRKLDEYILSDTEEKVAVTESPTAAVNSHRTGNVAVLEKKLEHLIRENARLKSLLMAGDRDGRTEGGSNFTSGSHQECSPTLVHQLCELRAARSLCIDQHGGKLEMMKLENFRQREEIDILKRTIHFTKSRVLEDCRPSWDYNRESHSCEAEGEGGHSSLPESLPSFSSGSSGYSRRIEKPSLSGSTLPTSSSASSSSSSENAAVAELKKLKKQLDKYKVVNIELDQKLKDANLELRKYAEQRGNWNIAHQMDVERLHSEGSHLRAQLDNALSENSRLRSMAGHQIH